MGRTSQRSTLPTFQLGDDYHTHVGDSKQKLRVVEVTCPRRSCGGTFVVVIKDWWVKTEIFGRSCPYCFKAAKQPRKPKVR